MAYIVLRDLEIAHSSVHVPSMRHFNVEEREENGFCFPQGSLNVMCITCAFFICPQLTAGPWCQRAGQQRLHGPPPRGAQRPQVSAAAGAGCWDERLLGGA